MAVLTFQQVAETFATKGIDVADVRSRPGPCLDVVHRGDRSSAMYLVVVCYRRNEEGGRFFDPKTNDVAVTVRRFLLEGGLVLGEELSEFPDEWSDVPAGPAVERVSVGDD